MGFHKEYPVSFQDVWDKYPNKKAKEAGFKAWKRLKFSEEDNQLLIDHIIQRCKDDPAWNPDQFGRTYIPHFSTFCNQRRWQDEYTPMLVPNETEQGALEDMFQLFWQSYPNKQAHKPAFEAFAGLTPADRTLVFQDVEARIAGCRQWQVDGGQYVPNPAKYLGERYFEDNWQAQEKFLRPDGLDAL